jgi:hypothetical protein
VQPRPQPTQVRARENGEVVDHLPLPWVDGPVVGEVATRVQDVRLLAQPGLDLAGELVASHGDFGQRRQVNGDLDPGDQRGLLVLSEKTPRSACPVHFLGAQHRDVGQLVAVHGAAQRGADAVNDRAVERAFTVGAADNGRRLLRLNGTEADFDNRPGQVRRVTVCLRTEVVRRGVGDKRPPNPLARHRGGMAVRGAEHCGQAGHEGARDFLARPHVAPTAAQQV